MNLIHLQTMAELMNDALRKGKFRWASLFLVCLTICGLLCLPIWAAGDDGEKSSRKNKSVPTEAASSKGSLSTPGKSDSNSASSKDKASDKASDKSSEQSSDKSSSKTEVISKSKDDRQTGRLELNEPLRGPATKNSLRAEGPVKLLSASENDQELSIEAQQKKDQGECPGSEGSKVAVTQNVNDTPLEQDDHPFDAPSAQTDDSPAADEGEPAPVKKAILAKSRSSALQSETARQLEQRINTCLAHYYTHKESLAKRSPWAVMHTILPFGVETDIAAGHRNVNAIGWMCYNGVCKTQRMFQTTNTGFRTNVGPGVQGHEGQFLAVLAQSSVPRSFPLVIGKSRYTVSDLIRYEMVTCREKSELTFKLIGLSHYLSPKQTWRDERGHTWNLEKLVREELDQPIVGAAVSG